MSCVFRVSGHDFQVDDFLDQSDLEPYDSWTRGESGLAGRVHESSGFKSLASDAEMTEPDQQITEAIEFLKLHADDLETLQHFPGVEMAWLDFGISDRDTPVNSDYFPPELLRLAGNLN